MLLFKLRILPYIYISRILQQFQFTNLSLFRFLVFSFNYLTILPIFLLSSLALLLNSFLYPHFPRVHIIFDELALIRQAEGHQLGEPRTFF